MTLSLELTTDEAERVSSIARQTASDVVDVIRRLIAQLPESDVTQTAQTEVLTQEEIAALLKSLCDGAGGSKPVFPE